MMNLLRLPWTLLLLACLTACTAQTTPAPAPVTESLSPTRSPTAIPLPTAPPTPLVLTAERVPPLFLPLNMVLEEYQLAGYPNAEGRDFTPVIGAQADVLAVRADQRDLPELDLARIDPNNTNQLRASLDGSVIFARLDDSEIDIEGVTYTQSILRVLLDKEEIHTMELGIGGPVSLLRGLWVYDGHWVVEAAKADPASEIPGGQIIQDGESLNEKFGYEETFEFQTLAGQPFYFFKRDDKIGAVYGEQEIPLDYDIVQHYLCCSGSAFNPLASENMVSFFAQRDDIWYYVELGIYE